jgi:hypothetical protein
VGVETLRHDPGARASEAAEAAKHSPCLCPATEEPEVLAEQDDRVERPERVIHVVDREQPCVVHAASVADPDRSGRRVDGHHLESPPLEVERDAASATARVEDAASDVTHGPALDEFPLPERCEEVASRVDGNEAVVAFDNLECVLAGQSVEQDLAVGVVSQAHPAVLSMTAT